MRLKITELREIESSSSSGTAYTEGQDSSDLIPHIEWPLNVFRSQLIFSNCHVIFITENSHAGYNRYFIPLANIDKSTLKEKLIANVVNGIKMLEDHLV